MSLLDILREIRNNLLNRRPCEQEVKKEKQGSLAYSFPSKHEQSVADSNYFPHLNTTGL